MSDQSEQLDAMGRMARGLLADLEAERAKVAKLREACLMYQRKQEGGPFDGPYDWQDVDTAIEVALAETEPGK